MGPQILCDDEGSEGLGQQIHLFQAEVLAYGIQITDEMLGCQERRIRELGAPATSLIVEDDHTALGERLEVRTAVVYACTWPTVNHDDGVVAGSGNLVEDPGTTRASQITLGRCSSCGRIAATHRNRGENQRSPAQRIPTHVRPSVTPAAVATARLRDHDRAEISQRFPS
jgi:hypothetical protein